MSPGGDVIAENNLVMVETNIDDTTPEIMASVIERLISRGARDAWITPIVMKKGRPGFMLSVLVYDDVLFEIEKLIFLETTTIGIREYSVNRKVLPREVIRIETEYGDVEVKVSYLNGKIISLAPEYESCRRVAREKNVPIRVVYESVYKYFSDIRKKFKSKKLEGK